MAVELELNSDQLFDAVCNISDLNMVKILLNALAFIQNSTFRIEGDGRLLEATL